MNLPAVNRRAETLKTRRSIKKQWQAAWLLRAVSCLDLTTLAGDDTKGNVARLCFKAQNPVRQDLLKGMAFDKEITVGAVCVYSTRVPDAVNSLKDAGSNIPVASVAAGFPAGRQGGGAAKLACRLPDVSSHIHTRLESLQNCLQNIACVTCAPR